MNFLSAHRNYWNKSRLISLFFGLLYLAAAICLKLVVDPIVAALNGVAARDFFWGILPLWDVNILVVYVPLVSTLAVVILLILNPRYINFTLKSLAAVLLIRELFICLSPLGVSPNEILPNARGAGYYLYNLLYNSRGDFFFSGHVGALFLMALIFWQKKWWRYLFVFLTVLMGISVLLVRLHYSIDVFAAPFMVYGIFILAKKIFAADFKNVVS